MSVLEARDLHRRYKLGELSVSALCGVDFVVFFTPENTCLIV